MKSKLRWKDFSNQKRLRRTLGSWKFVIYSKFLRLEILLVVWLHLAKSKRTISFVQRLVFALVNEGARILEEGIANKASDIDIVYIYGYGFPVHRGGPMAYANELGLFNVVQAMQRFARNPKDDASLWQPAPLLRQLVAESKTFS